MRGCVERTNKQNIRLSLKDNTMATSQGLIPNHGNQVDVAIDLWKSKGNSIYSKGNYKSGRV